MSVQTFITDNGNFTIFNLPSNIVGDITVSVEGASGGPGGAQINGNPGSPPAAIVNATIPATLCPLLLYPGMRPVGNGGPGGNGYSGGGAGGFQGGTAGYVEHAFGNWLPSGQTVPTPGAGYNNNPLYGNGGGGSSAIVCGAAANLGTLLVEAGGSDGCSVVETVIVAEVQFYWGFGGGGAGGYSGDAGGGGVSTAIDYGNPGAGGGSQGGTGGICTASGSVGGTGVGGQSPAFGSSAPSPAFGSTVDGGAGGGGGGVQVAEGVAGSYASSLLTGVDFGVGNATGYGSIEVQWNIADAPLAPVLSLPNNESTFDIWANGAIFTATYETDTGIGFDTGNLAAVCLCFTTTQYPGAIFYFNGTALVSAATNDEVWLIPTTGGGVTSGSQFTVSVPAGVIPDGYTYTWWFYTQESFQNVQGPGSNPVFTFTGAQSPIVAITSPINTVNTISPTLNWGLTTFSSEAQVAYEFFIFESAQYNPGTSPTWPNGSIYASGVVYSSSQAIVFDPTSPTLLSGNTYYGYLQVTATGGNYSAWTEFVFTPELISGATPVLSIVAATEPNTGMPAPYLSATYSDSLLGYPVYTEYQGAYNSSGEFADVLGGNAVYGTSLASDVYDLGAPFNVPLAYQCRTFYQAGAQIYFSDWSNVVELAGIPSIFWWVVPPTALGSSLQLFRLASSSSGSSTGTTFTPTTPAMPGSLVASIIVDDPEQMGIFRPFGKSTAIIVHGDIWGDEFDLDLYFESSQQWQAFKTIRDLQQVVLIKSDMEGTLYWVTLGGDLAPGIASRADRQKNPTRGLTVHCTPTDPYIP
jgi:hypothetical protein